MEKYKISLDEIVKAIEQDNSLGFCLACGEEAFGVEPDAHHYSCESCGEEEVFGAEELLMLGYGEE